jgi:hypothetical protein
MLAAVHLGVNEVTLNLRDNRLIQKIVLQIPVHSISIFCASLMAAIDL